jgi:hypothetical protein
LEDLGVSRIVHDDTFIGIFGSDVLEARVHVKEGQDGARTTHVFLLFVDVSNLEPDIGMGQRTWWVAKDSIEALERIVIFSLLFVYNAKTKQDFVCLVKI